MIRHVPIVDSTSDSPHSERVFAYESKRVRNGRTYNNINLSVGSMRLSFSVDDLERFLDDVEESVSEGPNVMITCGERTAVISGPDAKRVATILSGVRHD